MAERVPRTIRGRVRYLRGDLTQVEFAEILGINQPMVSSYESGVTIPSREVLLAMAICTGKSIEWILTGKTLPELRRGKRRRTR